MDEVMVVEHVKSHDPARSYCCCSSWRIVFSSLFHVEDHDAIYTYIVDSSTTRFLLSSSFQCLFGCLLYITNTMTTVLKVKKPSHHNFSRRQDSTVYFSLSFSYHHFSSTTSQTTILSLIQILSNRYIIKAVVLFAHFIILCFVYTHGDVMSLCTIVHHRAAHHVL